MNYGVTSKNEKCYPVLSTAKASPFVWNCVIKFNKIG